MGCGSSTTGHKVPLQYTYYTHDMKINTVHVISEDFRPEPEERVPMRPPFLSPGEQWTDQNYPIEVAIPKYKKKGLLWKRPSELTDNPVLFAGGTSRFDISQGRVETCWFLAMLSCVSERPELLKRIMDESSYDSTTGVFHCRFWKFGMWEDAWIDDFLPVKSDNLTIWGAHSKTNPNEMWVALLEKAFSKSHGSYDMISNGLAENAYLALTGGVADATELREIPTGSTKLPKDVISKIQFGLDSGALCTATCSKDADEDMGLVPIHEYALNYIKHIDYPDLWLVRLRNPWGRQEWKGDFSDGHEKSWSRLPQGFTDDFAVDSDDGEFWMNFTDFLKYFDWLTVCEVVPRAGPTRMSDPLLNNQLEIFGQWKRNWLQKSNETKYIFTVEANKQIGSEVPLVVQIIQKAESNKSDLIPMKCNLNKVNEDIGRIDPNKGYFWGNYSRAQQTVFRYIGEPGQYVVHPVTKHNGSEGEYLIRIYSNCRLLKCSVYEVPK